MTSKGGTVTLVEVINQLRETNLHCAGRINKVPEFDVNSYEMSPRTIRKFQNSQSLMGVPRVSIRSKPHAHLKSNSPLPSDHRNPPFYVTIRVSSLVRWHSFPPPAEIPTIISPSLALFLQR
ncbi:hypothetical protein AVEN_38685-1 [Araneus ventricosus]|uniref:Uncharacterized protein n=1 Tax=Araneus ventricosus TaxID=182803 RepID=A0A4Y2T957_ARAVE|nr:hypothetical protein AVEN_38685-1 [Araneus ventricosus]